MKFSKLEQIYKAFANSRRLSIIHYLSQKRSRSLMEITRHINLSLKSTSKHLQILKKAGLVEGEYIGRERFFYLVDKDNKFVKQFLTSV